MLKKLTEIYKDVNLLFAPHEVAIDFEVAIYNAVKRVSSKMLDAAFI